MSRGVGDLDVLEPTSLEQRRKPRANRSRPRVARALRHRSRRGLQTMTLSTPGVRRCSHAELVGREHLGGGGGRVVSVRACTSANACPGSTRAPRFACTTTPTAWSISSSFVRLPAPRWTAALPDADRAQRDDVALRRRIDPAHDGRDRQRVVVGDPALGLDPALPRRFSPSRRRLAASHGGDPSASSIAEVE